MNVFIEDNNGASACCSFATLFSDFNENYFLGGLPVMKLWDLVSVYCV